MKGVRYNNIVFVEDNTRETGGRRKNERSNDRKRNADGQNVHVISVAIDYRQRRERGIYEGRNR